MPTTTTHAQDPQHRQQPPPPPPSNPNIPPCNDVVPKGTPKGTCVACLGSWMPGFLRVGDGPVSCPGHIHKLPAHIQLRWTCKVCMDARGHQYSLYETCHACKGTEEVYNLKWDGAKGAWVRG